MKQLIYLLPLALVVACNSPDEKSNNRKEIKATPAGISSDSLHASPKTAYTPGFSEFMTHIQIHHAKLWFAGQSQNWDLADYEIRKIVESMDNIGTFYSQAPESKSMEVIRPVLDDIRRSVSEKSPKLFVNAFVVLTNTCNNCHKETQREFIVVTVPNTLPFSNEDFKAASK